MVWGGGKARRWERYSRRRGGGTAGLFYRPDFVTEDEHQQLIQWLGTLHPIWELRYSTLRPPPEGQAQRRLLRPVYWLGSWQFACLDYYRPPHGVHDRAIAAEPFPKVMKGLVDEVEEIARGMFRGPELPRGWALNTCLVNFYGRRREGDKWIDSARVGEHKDFEPGPVASISLGERALFQFVSSRRPGQRDEVVAQQWLDDGSLQLFGGDRWKRQTFHRVQRVDRRAGHRFPLAVTDFETRRINFTFRYVPREHVIRFAELGPAARRDVHGYVAELARHSRFFARELEAAGESGPGPDAPPR